MEELYVVIVTNKYSGRKSVFQHKFKTVFDKTEASQIAKTACRVPNSEARITYSIAKLSFLD